MSVANTVQICPLCHSSATQNYFSNKQREFHQCTNCFLIFAPKPYHISEELERQQYDHHQNSPENEGYRNFLSNLSMPLINLLSPQSHGLDFGCGPGPTLSVMLEEHDHTVDLYDQFYFKNETPWNKQYDFVTATEVLEHLREPRDILKKITSMIKPSGYFGCMTQITDNISDFQNWHYIRDLTHICFYHSKTFQFMESILGSQIVYQKGPVAIYQKINP